MLARLPFRLKLLIASAIALIAVTLALTASQATLVRRTLIEQLRGHAAAQQPFLVAAFASLLIERDYASIHAIVEESVRENGLAHLAVLDPRGNIIASRGWTAAMARTPIDAVEPIVGEDGLRRMPFGAEVTLGGQLLGSVHFGLSYEPVGAALRDLTMRGVVVAAFCLVVTIGIVRLLHARLMRPLNDLERASEHIRRGDYGFELAAATQRDFADLARSFGLMAEEIRRRIRTLSDSEEAQRRLLDEAIQRERDLSSAQQELASQAERLSRALENEREITQQQRRFVSIAAHEFRTPLTIIDGAAQRLARMAGSLSADELRQRADRIRGAVARMSQLIDRTLDAERIERGAVTLNWGKVDLADLLHQVGERVDLIAPDFRLTLKIADDMLGTRIDGDARLLDQVFSNLISNAVKFSGDRREAEMSLAREGETAVVVVRDAGIGIPEDELPKLFSRFFRAANAGGIAGTGLGLNLVRELLSLHGGSIEVASRVGEGSTFVIRLPLHRRPAADSAPRGTAGADRA